MPGDDGTLTPEEKAKISKWLQEKWPGEAKCPISGHDEWILADRLVSPLTRRKNAVTIGGPTYPLVMIICEGCGYTLFFNAVLIGIEAPTAPQEGAEEDASAGSSAEGTDNG
jgi:hypothetical protein